MMGKLKILFVCKTAPWKSDNGISDHNWNLARSLTKIDHDVAMVCGSDSGLPENSYIKEGVVITEVPYFHCRYTHALSAKIELYFFNQAVKKWINKNEKGFDIIEKENHKHTINTYDRYDKQLIEEFSIHPY